MSNININNILRNFIEDVWSQGQIDADDIPGFPASGKHIKMSGATVYYFAGDKITGHWQITDRLGVLQQLRSAP